MAAPRTLYRPTSSMPSPRISRTCTERRRVPPRPPTRPPAPRRRLPPARWGGRDERRPELAPGRRVLDGHPLGHAVTAGMTPPEMARDVGVPPPDLLGRQPRQQIHLIPDGTAAEERAHALGAGRRLARGEFV